MSKALPLRSAIVIGVAISICAFGQRGDAQGPTNLSPVAPFHMPTSIGLSPPSIGLSAPSIGLSPHSIPVAKPPLFDRDSSYPAERRRDHRTPGAFVAAPLFLPYTSDTVPADTAPATPETTTPDAAALSDQLKQLSQQLQNLRDELARNSTPTPEKTVLDDTAEPPPAPAITVVLKNGRSFQTQNYAVVGSTFWDLSSDPAHKLPVSTIDGAASQRATAANGAEFPSIEALR